MKKYCYFFGILLVLIACKEPQKEAKSFTVSEVEGKQLQINGGTKKDQGIESFIQPYAQGIEAEMNSVLSVAPQPLSKTDGQFNTAIGNMMADAVMEMAGPIFTERTGKKLDGVLLNHGGIRSTINRGYVTTQTAYNIMPFENETVVVELTAEEMEELFSYLSKAKRAHPISGMQLILNQDYSIQKATVQGKKLDKNKTYFIATSDYLQDGGDGMQFLSHPEQLFNLDYKLRNVFIDYFKKKEVIDPKKDERFIQR